MSKNTYYPDSASVMGVHSGARSGSAAYGYKGLHAGKQVRDLPEELSAWLAGLRLLEHVPFHYIVPDARMLPPESVRFFYLDRTWTDRLVDGAMSAGAVSNGELDLTREVASAARDSLDEASGTVGGHVTGFLLRSTLVRRWPRMEVRAYRLSPGQDTKEKSLPGQSQRLRNIRIARLSESILLALWHGVPNHVEIEEPKHGIQFGVNPDESPGGPPNIEPRKPWDGKNIKRSGDNLEISVPVRTASGTPKGVLDISQLASDLGAVSEFSGKTIDSRHVALALEQRPFIQPFRTGEVAGEGYYPPAPPADDPQFIAVLAHTVPIFMAAQDPDNPAVQLVDAIEAAPVETIDIAHAVNDAFVEGINFFNGDND